MVLRYFLVAVSLAWAALIPDRGANAKPLCKGDACAVLKLSADGCTLTNLSDRPVRARLEARPDRKRAGRRRKMTYVMEPLETRSAEERFGCVPASRLRSFTASFSGRARVAKHCDGDACGVVGLIEVRKCVWLENRGPEPAWAALDVGGKIRDFALDGAVQLKPKRQNQLVESDELKACRKALKFLGIIEDMKAGSSKVQLDSRQQKTIDLALECRAKSNIFKKAEKPSAVQTGDRVQTQSNDRSTGRTIAVFRARVVRDNGCVRHLSDIGGFAASFRNTGLRDMLLGALGRLAKPCSGNACGDLLADRDRLEKCHVESQGSRAFKLVVLTNGVGTSHLTVDPGKKTRLIYPGGCFRASQIREFEAVFE